MHPDVTAALARVTAALPGGGEARPGQAEMAEAVAEAIGERRHLVVQAGTGTGKSLGYLVPALLSGQRVVVATATKALQDQLADKDLPFLQQHLGVDFEFAVLKGRSNYVCRQKLREVTGGADTLELDDDVGALGREVARLVEFGAASESGDRAELAFEPRPRAWASVSVSGTECPGRTKCPSGEECFAEWARDRAALADVIVVNTHLYMTHLASGGHVLPEHDVVVFDEAHELEDVAAATLGLEITGGRFRALARLARPLVDQGTVVADLDGAADILEAALNAVRGARLPAGLGDELAGAAALAEERARRLVSALGPASGDDARKARAVQAGGHLVGDLSMCRTLGDGDVAWVEGPPHAPTLKVAPVDVSDTLATRLWPDVTAVLTSATIPLRLAERVGLPADTTDQLDVGSPFPYEAHARLYCAAHLPDPRRPEYEGAMHDELEWLVRAAGGRTLALFTSWRAMTAAADALRQRLPWPVLAQNDLPKPALIRAFADDEAASLFATMGFWQGVDVPGRSLSLVVLDRVPFPRPDEPLVQARRDRAGKAAFRVVDLPRAATLLAQGAGRLIRSSSDQGVVAVLDPRLATAGYRWDLVRALPPMTRTRHRTEVEAFLAAILPPACRSASGGGALLHENGDQ
ncbi:MAG TPA: ATP-dependent DNA helicase [Acidimicrobiales bacterium]|nr:ATP-dependent DNA helicase [Acidimicrobiales bacterium]